VVTTGVVTEFVELDAGDEAVADFGSLGEVRLAFTA
jgi:2-keto-4-pentenoate hydratase